MAGQADGSIIIDTELSSEGFKAGSSELLAAIKALSNEIKALGSTLTELFTRPITPEVDTGGAETQIASLEAQVKDLEAAMEELRNAEQASSDIKPPEVGIVGSTQRASNLQKQIDGVGSSVERLEPTFRKAMSGSESAISSFDSKAGALENKITELQDKLGTIGKTKYPTQEYAALEAEIDKTGKKLESLLNKQERLQDLGVKKKSAQWQALAYDLDAVSQKYDKLLADKARAEASGAAFKLGSDTSQYAQMESALSAVQSRLAEMRDGVNQSANHMGRFASAARSAASFVGAAAKSAVGALSQGVRSAASGMAKMLFHSKQMNGQFSGLISNAKKFALSLLVARGVYALLRKAVSAYMAENEQLSNKLSACWSGIGNLLGPIITKLINLVAQAVSYVTSFLQLFGAFGKSSVKAINNAGSAASGSAKELKRQLASFDELNVLSDSSGSDKSKKGGSNAELPAVELPDWVKMMTDQIKSGDWAGAATTLTTKLNGMVASVDWAGIGDKIGEFLNGALTFLATAILTFDWYALGKDLATGINHIIQNVDWANLGVVLGAKFIILIEGLGGLFSTLDWAGLGKALADAFMGLWNSIDWVQAAKTVSDGVIGVLTSIGTIIKNVDWQKLGHDVATFIANIDWSGVSDALFNGLGAALGGLVAFLWGLIEDAWNSVVDWWYDTAFEDGKFTMSGLLEGIWNGIKNIGSWIYDHIFKPFIDGFKSIFGIASPSKVMAEQGNFIIQGLLNGITGAWGSITSFFSSALSTVCSAIRSAWSKVKSWTSEAWSKIKSTIGSAWDGIKSGVSSGLSAVKSGVSTAWGNIKSWTSEKWGSIKASLSSTWDSIKSKSSSTWNGIKSTIGGAWNGIKSGASSAWNGISSSLSNTWSKIKSNASQAFSLIKQTIQNKGWSGVGSNICKGISDGISSGWKWLKKTTGDLANGLVKSVKSFLGIHSPSRVFRDEVGVNIGLGVGEGVERSESSVLRSVSSVADAIANEFNSGDYPIKGIVPTGEINGALDNFTGKITDSFSSMLDRLQTIAESVTFIAPGIVTGAIPYRAAAAASSGSGTDVSATIEASNDELVNVVTQVVTNATASIVSAIQTYSSTTVNLDKHSLADAVIQEINRRTRSMNKSPLLG